MMIPRTTMISTSVKPPPCEGWFPGWVRRPEGLEGIGSRMESLKKGMRASGRLVRGS